MILQEYFSCFLQDHGDKLKYNIRVIKYKRLFTMDDETLIKLSYVKISSYRAKTVRALKDEVKIPIQIADDAGIRRNHVSKVLHELKDAGIAECINEDSRKGRLYRLTPLGDEIAQNLEK